MRHMSANIAGQSPLFLPCLAGFPERRDMPEAQRKHGMLQRAEERVAGAFLNLAKKPSKGVKRHAAFYKMASFRYLARASLSVAPPFPFLPRAKSKKKPSAANRPLRFPLFRLQPQGAWMRNHAKSGTRLRDTRPGQCRCRAVGRPLAGCSAVPGRIASTHASPVQQSPLQQHGAADGQRPRNEKK